MSDEPNWTTEYDAAGSWYVVAYTMKGRTVVAGPYAKAWQANMIKGERARDWRATRAAAKDR